MFVLIVGGGRSGTQLALLLLAQNHEVHVVEYRRDVLAHLHRDLPTEVIYEGYPTDLPLLEAAGIREAQAVAAQTTSDADNLAVCYLARTRYNVPRTIARINNPRSAWLFSETFHVDVALNQAEILASLIQEEMEPGAMMTLLKLQRGHYSLVEEKIPAGARAVGVAIKDLALPEHCVIAAIIRNGIIVMPRGITTMAVGDEVLAVTDRHGAEELAKLFAAPAISSKERAPRKI